MLRVRAALVLLHLGGPSNYMYALLVSDTISHTEKRSRGRPKVGSKGLHVALPPEQLAALDAWIAAQPEPRPSRPEALRKLAAAQLGRPADSYTPGQVLILNAVTAAELIRAHPDPKPAIADEAFRNLAELRRRD